jgi:hypothetical protein
MTGVTDVRRAFRPLLLVGGLAVLALPAPTAASTNPEPSPPPCALDASTLEAGTPLALAGTRSTEDPVGVMIRRADGEFREPAVVTINQTWRAVLLFGAADGGRWTVEVSVDGASCVSPLTVTQPTGVVAPPTPTPGAAPRPDTSAGAIDSASLRGAAVLTAAAVVVASWVFLVLLALVRASGRRAMARRPVRVAARAATFVAILGAGVAAWAIAYLMDSLLHFDTGVPPDQRAVLDGASWAVVVFGSVLGTLAALRVRVSAPAGEVGT